MTLYYPVSLKKLIILSLFTAGCYLFFVWYRNFDYIRKREHSHKSPFWRSLFMIFTVYQLYGDVNKTAKKKLTHPMPYCFLFASLFFISLLIILYGTLCFNLASLSQMIALMLLNVVSLIAYIPLQKTINDLNIAEGMRSAIDDRFRLKTLLAILFGLLFWYANIQFSLMMASIAKDGHAIQKIISTYNLPLPPQRG